MKKYRVYITISQTAFVDVNAENEDEAIEKASDLRDDWEDYGESMDDEQYEAEEIE